MRDYCDLEGRVTDFFPRYLARLDVLFEEVALDFARVGELTG